MYDRHYYTDYVNRAIEALSYPETPAGLYAPVAYMLAGGGKRLRPVLTLATCDALGGDHAEVIKPALGVEMFHNFTLLHDDVMDRADVRHGRATVHRRWSEAAAILSGDAMLTLATQLVADCRSELLPEVLSLFNTTAIEIYEGQQYDMDFESRDDVTVDEYLHMIRLKTSVLLGCACRMGAIMAGADTSACDGMTDYGTALGMAFQLQDDLLDTYGDPAVFGKAIGGDILNEKKTYLLITAKAKADDEHRRVMESWHGRRDDAKIAAIRDIYDQLGVADDCRRLIDDYTTRAIDALDNVPMADEGREFFTRIAVESVNRRS